MARKGKSAEEIIGALLEAVGLIEQERGGHRARFCGRTLGLLDAAGRFHRYAPPRARLRSATEPAKEEE